MGEHIQTMNIPISMKNIGIPTEFQYQKSLVFRIEDFIRRLRWRCLFIGAPTFHPILYENSVPQNMQDNSQSQNKPNPSSQNPQPEEETPEFEKQQVYGFKSENSPPVIKELVQFEEELYKLARNIKFRKIHSNKFQNLLKQSIRNVKTSKDMVISADKSHSLYKIPVPVYKKMLRNVVTETYKISSQNKVAQVNKDTLNLIQTHEAGLETKVEVFTQTEAFISVKDHKNCFPQKVDVRLINPAKPQLGKITKIKLQTINSELRYKTKLNQLQSTNDAISWFNSLKYKKQRYFLIFDVVKFYPSISENILKKTFNWARTLVNIPSADEELVFMARKSFLFMNEQPWVKKENPTFDVTMGSYDGAEVAEFVGLFLLNELSHILCIHDYALYRDDGICAVKGSRSDVDRIRKQIEKVFKNVGLKLELPKTPAKSVNFLDLNMNLTTGFHAPYRKPSNEPLFINKDSNHPPNIIKEIPRMVAKRLSNNSSNEHIFDNAKHPYIESLKRSGFENVELNYTPRPNKPKTKKSNTKNVLYCNLPWNMAVKNNIGREFLSLVDMFKNSPQGKYINRHTIKLSYSTMPNLKSQITSSNRKKINGNQSKNPNPEQKCKCDKDKNIKMCPVNGQCLTSNVVYSAEVKTRRMTKSYIGMTGRTFIERWKEHRGNIRHQHQKGTKLSKFIWEQKESGESIKIEDIKWSLKTKAIPYKAGAKYCDTCLSEKTHIALSHPNDILNSRKEIVGKCPHKRDFKLKFYKPP